MMRWRSCLAVVGASTLALSALLVTLGAGSAGGADPLGQITEVATGGVTPGFTASVGPDQIVAGPDGNLWFIELTNPGRIATITPAGDVTEVAEGGVTPGFSANTLAQGMTAGPDGNLWFTEL